MTAYELRSYPGNAAETTLSSDITNAALSIPAVSAAGYSDGTSGPAHIIVDYDNSKAEKIRYTSLSGNSFVVTAGGRAQDGTTAVAHSAGAKIRAVWTATDAAEANKAAHYTVGLVTTKGDLLAGTGANVLARLAAGANNTLLVADSAQAAGVKWAGALPAGAIVGTTDVQALTNKTLDAASTLGGVSGTTLAADRAAWTAYTPTISGITSGAGNFFYKLIGKTLYLRGAFTAGSSLANNAGITVSLPGGVTTAATDRQMIPCGTNLSVLLGWANGGGTTFVINNISGSAVTPSNIFLNAVIEVA